MIKKSDIYRCGWASKEVYFKYHDTEWGKPVRNDKKHFEFLILEGAQAGLNWETILKKREGYRKAFYNFDVKKVARLKKRDIERLLKNDGIVKNRLKIESTINNAKLFIEIQKEFGSFNKYVWRFVDNKTIKKPRKHMKDIPTTTKEK